ERQLKVLVFDGDDEDEAEAKVLAVEVDESDDEQKGELCVLNLSHLAFENHKTVKFQGQICGVPVLILVDSGASHNFVSQKLVHMMGWVVEETPMMNIKLGDGFRAQSQGAVKGLELCIGEFKLTPNLQLFELGGIDVVLGMEWLKTLGDMIVNWRQQTMSFWSNKKWVTLQGIDGGEKELVALQCILSKPKLRKPVELWGIEQKKKEEGSELSNTQQRELEEVLNRYLQVFEEPSGLPPRRNKEHAINLIENHGAVNVRPYRYPHHHKNEIEKQVQELLAAGVIRHSTSSFSSPVILVKKKDNSWRMCIDYRALNKVTIPNKFPIPVIEELLDELHGANFFSKLDLKSGYHQVRVKEEDIGKTAFRTHEGHYEFLVMPFGLMNAPSTFQSLMNDVFRPLLRKCVLVFFDDILIYSRGWSAHMAHLEEVLHLLAQNSLVANKKKCSFGQKTVEYLGHLITGGGVAVDPNKVKSVMMWPIPKNVKGVRGFLGLTGYYRKFIRDYGKIAKPLTELTKKEGFKWGKEAQAAFDELKQKLTTAPVLSLPDFSKTFMIE
ncbi:RNA-directed DNA polymerase (Reverse transcriptase), partial [Trifolium medium]|nr:RNA-directed DNA polymerase (Reverse transcriptase) [Trifolium medium]